MSHFSPSHEPLVILYLVLHFSEVWKCGMVRQSKDIVALSPQSRIPWHSFLSYTPMYEMRIKRSGSICWFYSWNSFYIFLNTIFKFRKQYFIFKFRKQFCEDISLVSLLSVWIPDLQTSLRFLCHEVPVSPLSSFIYLFIFQRKLQQRHLIYGFLMCHIWDVLFWVFLLPIVLFS